MADPLPPLTALRAFDAAARHMSFARAADELHVTPAALSFQIKSLEQHLGQPLFRRLNRAVALTEAGQALAPGAADGFAMLGTAWRAAKRVTDQRSLTVTAGPAFTAKWLAPRLYDFAQAHPEIQLRLSAGLSILDLERDDVDVALRFGYGPDAGLFSQPILHEWFTPMMSPAMAARFDTPGALAAAPLIHQSDTRFLTAPCDWAAWFRAAGIAPPEETGVEFSQADHAIDAAVAGSGVILGRISLTQRALADGRLVAPFTLALTTQAHYRFLCAKGSETRPQIAAFKEWILAETSSIKDWDNGMDFVDAEHVHASRV